MNPRVAILLAALLFSTGGAAIKASPLTAWQIASGRSAIAAMALVLLLPTARRLAGRWVWIAGLAYAATLVLFVAANKLTTAAAAIWLQATAPIHLLILAPRLLGEAIRPRDWALGGVMALSVGLLLADALGSGATRLAPDPLLGNCLAAASGLTFALAVLAIRHEARSGAGSLPVVVAGNLLAAAATAPAALAGGPPMPAAADFAGLLYLGVVQVGLAYWLLDRGIRRVPAFEASACLLVEPAMSPVWAWLATGERPGPLALAGGAAILAATLLHASPSRAWKAG
jgi:DME family drug/metabolite transporter